MSGNHIEVIFKFFYSLEVPTKFKTVSIVVLHIVYNCPPQINFINPLTPGTFRKKCVFLNILVIFTLDLGQITFNPVENAFA